jgi:hypothetical protein
MSDVLALSPYSVPCFSLLTTCHTAPSVYEEFTRQLLASIQTVRAPTPHPHPLDTLGSPLHRPTCPSNISQGYESIVVQLDTVIAHQVKEVDLKRYKKNTRFLSDLCIALNKKIKFTELVEQLEKEFKEVKERFSEILVVSQWLRYV